MTAVPAGAAERRIDTPPPAPPHARRGGSQALLLGGAVVVSVYGYINTGLALDGAAPSDTLRYAGGLAALALIAHLAVRLRAPCADPVLLPIAVLLNGLGLVLIHRLDRDHPEAQAAAPVQLLWSAVGVGLFIAVLAAVREHGVLQRYGQRCAVAALVLMIAPIFFPAVNGARIWVRIGGLSLQPGEFAKVLLAVFFAAYLAANREALTYIGGRRIRGLALPPRSVLGPIVAVWAVCLAILLLERDLGASLLFFGLFVAILYVATNRPGWLAVGLLLAALGACAMATVVPHVRDRVDGWLAPLAGIEAGQGTGQLAQSLFSFAGGGLLGTGLGRGESELIGFAGKSDFILATAGEELGLSGLTALLLLYALFVSRGYRGALGLAGRNDDFGALLAVGLSVIVTLQAFVISAGVLGLIPLTGMVMPFLAQGGSSMVTNWVIVALLVHLTHAARKPDPAPEPASEPQRTTP
ncbi:FtsW/RodA/SpoVE family cell cycle protein [Streptomyces boninensis]|uniref:FtsW/RodA/SpoVE family cell cycle protein n=1 Tax=Streptomyces boninensis TaxID=2039455 RepID=UPI003B217000